MKHTPDDILGILDAGCDSFTFPMLDNGYVYLAATRLSLFRSVEDWAMVIEVFGYSPRSGFPDTHVHTFASTLSNRDSVGQYVNQAAYQNYLANNPNNQSRFVYPIDEGPWIDPDNPENVATTADLPIVRGHPRQRPGTDDYLMAGVIVRDPPTIHIYEFCRALAHEARDDVLATLVERRASIPVELQNILTLDSWHHPDVVHLSHRPSKSPTLRQLAQVLVTGDLGHYQPSEEPNTHWRNWPEGGSL
jgi:hypothetical protein